MIFKPFNATETPLTTGINLIEASAGTGKTYTIAMLIVRFIVEQGLLIEQLLIVTFTKAATEELKDRIRARLVEAKQALDNTPGPAHDSSLHDWLHSLDIDSQTLRTRLNLALMNIDQADIFTIHGFCQRILTEHALESGQLFNCELTEDIKPIQQQCSDDFWRQQLYLRDVWESAVLTRNYATPDDLFAAISPVSPEYQLLPEVETLDTLFQRLRKQAKSLPKALDNIFSALSAALTDNKFKKNILENILENKASFYQWAQGESITIPDFSALTRETLFKGLNGNKLRGDDKKNQYLDELGLETTPFSQLQRTLQHIDISFRQNLYCSLINTLPARLAQHNLMSFDDLITRLAHALQGDQKQHLQQALQQRYKAAFIDEFQDTDSNQWMIFSTLFQASDQFLFLIGDPKQAIYKFRGADIYSYFTAQTQAQHLFTLHKNWRSHPRLVAAVNTLFEYREHPFLFKELAFNPVAAAKSADDGEIRNNTDQVAPLILAQLAENGGKQPYWTKTAASAAIQQHVVAEILSLLNGQYTITTKNQSQAVKPSDIAILVRTHAQAQDYQRSLNDYGIPAIVNSNDSVFSSQEAHDLYTLLSALEQPANSALLKQALALHWFGLDGQTFYQLSQDDILLEQWIIRFHDYHQLWQKSGLLSMMTAVFSHENIITHLARQPQAERILTNINHLLELAQQAANEHHLGPNKILDWLHHAITQKSQQKEAQLRLESDENAVKIITLHSAKGLEFPIVFCPVLWDSGGPQNDKKPLQFHRNGQIYVDFGSDELEQHKELATNEQQAEDIRLFYVALTRAKFRCYLHWADVRTKDKPNQSAMGWLLQLAEQDFSGQQRLLQSFAENSPDSFAYQLLDANIEIDSHYQIQTPKQTFAARRRLRDLSSHWQMSSYTALSALSMSDSPDFPQDKAGESDDLIDEEDIDLLPKGAHTGNVLHDILEKTCFQTLANGDDISQQRQQSCLRYGLSMEQPEIIDRLLQTAVNTPLSHDDPDFKLANIPDHHCIKEMPFYLALKTTQIEHINAILADCPAVQPLSRRKISGFLTGFIDLVCYYNGRYYVMDYKSNALNQYTQTSLTQAMRDHNYGLQYWLYALVLHYALKNRLPDYQFEQHFGGIKYLFLRGMQAEHPESGVYSDTPDLETLEMLAELFFPNHEAITTD